MNAFFFWTIYRAHIFMYYGADVIVIAIAIQSNNLVNAIHAQAHTRNTAMAYKKIRIVSPRKSQQQRKTETHRNQNQCLPNTVIKLNG